MKDINKITTIYFDLFGVLLGSDQSTILQYLTKTTRLDYLEVKNIAMGETFMKLERQEINFNQYIEEIKKLLPNEDKIQSSILKDLWMGSNIAEMPAVSLLNKLNEKYKIWIISNTLENHIEKLKTNFSFLNHIDGIITSEKAGVHKPNPFIFNFALNNSNSSAFNSLFIDDTLINTNAAENMGFKSYHVTNYDQFMSFLYSLII